MNNMKTKEEILSANTKWTAELIKNNADSFILGADKAMPPRWK